MNALCLLLLISTLKACPGHSFESVATACGGFLLSTKARKVSMLKTLVNAVASSSAVVVASECVFIAWQSAHRAWSSSPPRRRGMV